MLSKSILNMIFNGQKKFGCYEHGQFFNLIKLKFPFLLCYGQQIKYNKFRPWLGPI